VTDPTAGVVELAPAALIRAASLAGMGRKSGDLVVGLSAIRRTRELALVLVETGIASRTLMELAALQHRGAQVFRVQALAPLTRVFGRDDVHVIAVKRGHLADGMLAKLLADPPPPSS
jgi:hypothetical protein